MNETESSRRLQSLKRWFSEGSGGGGGESGRADTGTNTGLLLSSAITDGKYRVLCGSGSGNGTGFRLTKRM